MSSESNSSRPRSLAVRYAPFLAIIALQLVLVTSVVNGVYEELFVAGYVITAMTPVRGMWTANNVSTGIRLLYHLYQGPVALLSIIPLGVLFAAVYWRTRTLWPLLVAHTLANFLAFSMATGN